MNEAFTAAKKSVVGHYLRFPFQKNVTCSKYGADQ